MLQNLKKEFGKEFASTAFQTVDNERRIVGKFGSIAQLDNGTIDVWFVGPDLEPLSGQKLAAIVRKAPQNWHLTILTGEAYAQGQGREFVRQAADLCGVRKRRRISQSERERLKSQVAKARDVKRQAA